jgi:hypothetical protein
VSFWAIAPLEARKSATDAFPKSDLTPGRSSNPLCEAVQWLELALSFQASDINVAVYVILFEMRSSWRMTSRL